MGLHLDFSYPRLAVAASGRPRAGARLIASNDDATYPGEHGLSPGAGSLLAAVVTASGVEPTVAGQAVPADGRAGPGLAGPEEELAVGDRADTDGRFARAARLPVRTRADRGHHRRPDLPVDPAPDAVAEDLAALVDQWIAAPW